MSTRLLRDLPAATPAMLAAFGDAALLRAALDFEAQLAAAQAAEGVIPPAHAALIGQAAAALAPDIATLAAAAAHAGTLAIPLVALLRASVAATDAAASKHVHLGSTSQDVNDTALALQLRTGVALLAADLARIEAALAALAERHAATPALGRTLLQPARPITFGLKLANWLLGVREAAARLRAEAAGALLLQLGGAVGTLDGMGGRGEAVTRRLAAALGLGVPALPWQARRGNLAGLGAACAIVAGTVGKMARDISLLAQFEVGEAAEPVVAGRGGSSAMAHKQNQTLCQVALTAALRAPGLAATLLAGLPQEHERGLGGWQAEATVLADLFCAAHAGVAAMAEAAEGLRIDPDALARNLARADVGAGSGEAERMTRAVLREIITES